MHFIKSRPDSLFNSWFIKKNFLYIIIFSNLVVVKQEKFSYILKKRTSNKAINKVMRSLLAKRG